MIWLLLCWCLRSLLIALWRPPARERNVKIRLTSPNFSIQVGVVRRKTNALRPLQSIRAMCISFRSSPGHESFLRLLQVPRLADVAGCAHRKNQLANPRDRPGARPPLYFCGGMGPVRGTRVVRIWILAHRPCPAPSNKTVMQSLARYRRFNTGAAASQRLS